MRNTRKTVTAVAGTITALMGVLAFGAPAHAGTAVPPKPVEHGMVMPADGQGTSRYVSHPEGGGTWTHGTDGANNTAYSNFHHSSRKHGSSVQNGRGRVRRSADTRAGSTARASITKTYAGNSAYYRFVK
ncbi:lactococcin 972 family bacteriocin [Curtobacterium sp. ER1/6]|uniref:lactococcin 972 family bacteriocin n=1 Tax=Curtobacterium sp. ER1/6 TaxID=1891920 RepID=UPI00084FA06E|nr:lactococcin 972 family bacteriocin [Curtobacterium sp. ER1/6]